MAGDYYCSDHVGENGKGGNENSRCASSLLCSENWKPLVEGNEEGYGAEYAIGGPTLEMWVASWNQKHGAGADGEDNGITLYANGNHNMSYQYGYSFGRSTAGTDSPNWGYREGITSCSGGYDDKLYFPHKTEHNLDLVEGETTNRSCGGYYLASPSAAGRGTGLQVSYWGCITDCSVHGDVFKTYSYGLRPVVCLKSGVKLVDASPD